MPSFAQANKEKKREGNVALAAEPEKSNIYRCRTITWEPLLLDGSHLAGWSTHWSLYFLSLFLSFLAADRVHK
jgi:hypothetical protein